VATSELWSSPELRGLRQPDITVVAATAVVGVAAAAGAVWIAETSDHVDQPTVRAALVAWVVLAYVIGGLVAWWRRPGRFGPLLIAAGFAMFVSSLSMANVAVPFTIGIAFDLVPAVLFVHAFLAFPTGYLHSRAERALIAVGYVTCFAVQLLTMALGGFGNDNLLEAVSSPQLAERIARGQLYVVSAIVVIGVGLLVWGRGPRQLMRAPIRLLVNAFAVSLLSVAFLFTAGAAGLTEGHVIFETIRRVTFFVIGLAPLAFLVGLVQARLLRSSVGDLVLELRDGPAAPDLRDALVRALRDPSLTVAFWLPDFQTYADADGREVDLAAAADGRATTLIERNGVRVAALLHDPALQDEPELLDAVTAAAGIALENGRLNAELKARADELAESRARVVDAEQKERQRLERNLHDGAQQRLVALSLELSRLDEHLDDDPEARDQVERAREQIALSLAELRDVARGIHPAVVTAHGLEVALEDLVVHAAAPVDLDISVPGRLPGSLEVAAYYVVCESLANVGKYAEATSVRVTVSHEDGALVVEVVDDGVGGADTERGSGLRGLADRVETLGGRLRVWSPHGGGTRVRAEMPCAS
jgi:signal transduction histidine kinase